MASLKQTSISQGTIKTLTILNGDLILSNAATSASIEDSENTSTTSYVPYSTGYNEVSLFGSSQDIEIGKSNGNVKLYIYGKQPAINMINSYKINSSLSSNGWLNTTYGINGLPLYSTYGNKTQFKASTNSSFDTSLSIYTTDSTNPQNISEFIKFDVQQERIIFRKPFELNNATECRFLGNFKFESYSGGNRNLVVRNKLILTDEESYIISSSGGIYRYLGESGLVFSPQRTGYFKLNAEATMIEDNIFTGYKAYKHTFSVITYAKGSLYLYRPATSSTSSRWKWHGGSFVSPTGNATQILEPSWWNTGANRLQMNFTGQHRNKPLEDLEIYKDKVGTIVVSCGSYVDLDGNNTIQISNSLPTITFSSKRNQKNVFGVVSNKEDENSKTRTFSYGSWISKIKKPKGKESARVIVNSTGEGAIWVCNINGNFENGDYITTCEIPGYGMRQDTSRMANYTVAKITCDCDFNLESEIYKCEEFEWEGQIYRKAFVGCTYHCG